MERFAEARIGGGEDEEREEEEEEESADASFDGEARVDESGGEVDDEVELLDCVLLPFAGAAASDCAATDAVADDDVFVASEGLLLASRPTPSGDAACAMRIESISPLKMAARISSYSRCRCSAALIALASASSNVSCVFVASVSVRAFSPSFGRRNNLSLVGPLSIIALMWA